MKVIIISIIVVLFILMGVSDALKDNGSIQASKIVESTYEGIMLIGTAFLVNAITMVGISIRISVIHYIICLGILHQSLVNISYGIVRDGIGWWFIGSTSGVDRVLYWFINDALKAPQVQFLFLYYLIPSGVALFVLYRNALKE